MVAALFGIFVAIIIAGWLWFYIARPILEDYGIIHDAEVVRPYQGEPMCVCSSPAFDQQVATQPQRSGIKKEVPVSVSVSGTDTAGFDLASVPSDLTYEEIVTILAGQMISTGKPAYSGKKIYSLVGGNYNDFTVLMRKLRAKDEALAESSETLTPIAQRPTRAIFHNDPDLSYQPLE